MKNSTRPRALRARRVRSGTRNNPIWRTASHEAAHAVIAALLGVLGDSANITVVPEAFVYGSVEFSKNGQDGAWKRWGVRYIRKAICAYYAGPAASMKLEPCLDLFEEGGPYELDMIAAEELCRWIGDPAYTTYEPDKDLVFKTRNWKKAVALVEQNWPTIMLLADELIERKAMRGYEVKALLG